MIKSCFIFQSKTHTSTITALFTANPFYVHVNAYKENLTNNLQSSNMWLLYLQAVFHFRLQMIISEIIFFFTVDVVSIEKYRKT